MGVTTEYLGRIDMVPRLNRAEHDYLPAFGRSRRSWRPRAAERFNRICADQPSYYCRWVPCPQGCCLSWDGVEKFYGGPRWMLYLIGHVLRPGALPQDCGVTLGHPGAAAANAQEIAATGPVGSVPVSDGVPNVIDELTWRGLIANSTDPEALREHLSGPVTFYIGFDPTAPSLHFGNLVQLIVARHLQAADHTPLILVGGSTGQIGDPKDSGERTLNSKEVVAGWVERIRSQVSRFVSFEGANAATVVNNLDWTADVSVLDFLRDIGKHFPVNRMLGRDVVRNRLDAGISYTEFSYVLLQSMDYLELFRRYGCTLQFGGSDQWGNITAGVELVRRADESRVHALATPLLTKADGTKFGKTEGGAVWLDPTMTSPYAFHQFFLNAEDAKVVEYLKVFSPRRADEIAELARLTETEPYRRAAQHALADDVTTLVHSAADTASANAAAAALFGRADLRDLDAGVLQSVVDEVGGVELSVGESSTSVTDVLTAGGVVASRSAARRAVEEGGAYINNVRVADPDALLSDTDLLAGRYVIVRRGKKTVGAVTVVR